MNLICHIIGLQLQGLKLFYIFCFVFLQFLVDFIMCGEFWFLLLLFGDFGSIGLFYDSGCKILKERCFFLLISQLMIPFVLFFCSCNWALGFSYVFVFCSICWINLKLCLICISKTDALKWTHELHQRFTDAINQLGGAESKCDTKNLLFLEYSLYHI